MMCSNSLSEATCFNSEQPVDSQAEPMVQSVWRVKRRSALDRHAAFVKRLERQRLAREKSCKEGAESKIHAESRLHSFTKKLRHAILHNADVASAWRPAAHMRDVKATLDRKLHDQWSARAASQASCVAGGNPALPNDLLDEMSHFVDQALRDAPASCNSPTTSIAALASASTAGPVSSADVQPSADDREAGAEGLCQQMPDQASNQLQERDEQGPKRSSDRLGNSESVRSIGSKKVNKPAWAMTADAALDAEQQEEEDLLAFAGGLEFDKYINQQEDAKLRTALQDMRTAHESDSDANKATLKKHVVRAINNLANKDVKPGEGNTGHGAQSCCQRSEAGASTFSRATVASKAKDATSNPALLAGPAAEATAKWDTSTRAGSDVGSMGKQDLKAGCGGLFRENPEMKQVHSLASAAALLKRVADSCAA